MASDLCILYNNAADYATITANTTAGNTSADNLKNDIKGLVHKSTGASVVYSCTWSTAQTIGAIAFPAINANSGTTVSISINGSAVVTGVTPFTYTDINAWYTGSATANEFPYGRYSSGIIILPTQLTNVTSCEITVTLSGSGTIECARLVIAPIWRPNRYASNGIKIEKVDTSSITRVNTGNLVIDTGFQYDTLTFDIKYMEETDRGNLIKLLKMVGSYKYIFLTLFPSQTNRLSQDYCIYGRIISSPITYEVYNLYTYNVNVESW